MLFSPCLAISLIGRKRLKSDIAGRLTQRTDTNNAFSETFAYDTLGRLATAQVDINIAKTYNYNSIGDLIGKSDVGNYVLREVYKGEELKGRNVVPGLGERWDRPLEEQLGISIPEESLPAMTEKIVRGITFREDGAFIEPDQKIQSFLVRDEDVKDVKELLDRAGKEFKREPGLIVRRARSEGGDLYEITFWNQLKMYATVSMPKRRPAMSPRQRRALRRARLNAWLQRRAARQGRPKAMARRRARKRAQRRPTGG